MLSFPSQNHRSKGFTLIELLVVISIIAILAGMLLPVIGVVREMARQAQCGKNQSQILGAMVAYSTQEETSWPDPRGNNWKLPAADVTENDTAAKFTGGAFELLAAAQGIGNSLFKCPSAAVGGPNKNVKPTISAANTDWGWGVTDNAKVSYAFDWASPADPASSRVILADRDVKYHSDASMACFGDAHVKKLKKTTTAGAAVGTPATKGIIQATVALFIENPDAKGAAGFEDDATNVIPDNIYDGGSDFAAPSTQADLFKPGGGHAKRAFVK